MGSTFSVLETPTPGPLPQKFFERQTHMSVTGLVHRAGGVTPRSSSPLGTYRGWLVTESWNRRTVPWTLEIFQGDGSGVPSGYLSRRDSHPGSVVVKNFETSNKVISRFPFRDTSRREVMCIDSLSLYFIFKRVGSVSTDLQVRWVLFS